jgi:hypothetical protein
MAYIIIIIIIIIILHGLHSVPELFGVGATGCKLKIPFPIWPSYHHGHLIILSLAHYPPLSPVTIAVNENVFSVNLPGKTRVK